MSFISTHMTNLRDRLSRQGAPRGLRAATSRQHHRGDDGITLIEVVVAILLLAIIITPIASLVISTGGAVNQDRVRLEAINVATSTVESIQNNASFGRIDNTETVKAPVTLTENGGSATPLVQTFYVTTNYTYENENGTTLCTAAASSAPQIWVVTVQVDWTGDNNSPAEQTTYIAPDQAGQVPLTAGTLVVPVYSSTPGSYYATSVPVTVNGTWTGPVGGAGATVPNGELTYETGSSGTTGCAVFPNLDAVTGWTYTAYLGVGACAVGSTSCPAPTPPAVFDGVGPYVVTSGDLPGLVNTSLATGSAASQTPADTAVSLVLGSPVLAAGFTVDPGVNVGVKFSTLSATCTGACASITPAADLPVTIAASEITPYSFDTTSTSTQINSVTLYPWTDYKVWAGDSPDSSPTYFVSPVSVYGSDVGLTVNAQVSPPASITLPVYPVVLAVTPLLPFQTITVQDVNSPKDTFTLNPLIVGTTTTGLPLGEYAVYSTLTGSTVLLYIWVTPTGNYYGASTVSLPTQFTKPPAVYPTPIPVTS